jgi:hypothetical protein
MVASNRPLCIAQLALNEVLLTCAPVGLAMQPADWDDREYITDPDAKKPDVSSDNSHALSISLTCICK